MSIQGVDRPFVTPRNNLITSPGLIELDKGMTVYTLNKQTGEIKLHPTAMPEMVKEYFISKGAVLPVYDPYQLRQFAGIDSTHSACIRLKKLTVSGMGYYFRNKAVENNKAIQDFIMFPSGNGGEVSFIELMKSMYDSHCTYGYGYWEFVKYGNMYKLYKIDSPVDIFVVPKTDGAGNYLQEIDHYEQIMKDHNSIKRFYPFNMMDKSEIVNGRHYLLRYANNYKQNSFYAVPDYYSSIAEIKSNYYIQTCNSDYYKNRMHPDLVFIFTGGHLQTTNKQTIEEFYQQNTKAFKGFGNQHKTMVLSKKGKDAKIEIHELNKINSDFNLSLKTANDISIARSHNVQTKLVSISQGQGGLVGGSADIGQLFTQHQLNTKPSQVSFETFINVFFYITFGVNPEIKLETVDLVNPKDMAVIHSLYYKNGVMGRIEQRGAIAHTGLGVKQPLEMPDDIIVIQDKTGVNDRGAVREDENLDDNKDDANTVNEDKFGKKIS
jgi:hypothetical protein